MASAEPPNINPDDKQGFARFLRSVMGWENDDITKTGITTKQMTIEGTSSKIPIRMYSPSKIEGRLPAVVFFHGGGFVGGSVDVVENPCKALAEKANAIVISVNYRLAPEDPFPAGLIDCFDAVEWVYQHADELQVNRDRISVAGDSAGGNMAAVCALMDRDRGLGMIKYQALIYPTVNLARATTDDFQWRIEEYIIRNHHELITPGLRMMGEGPNILGDVYLQGNAEDTDPRVSPLLTDLSGLPETLIITAEYDGLRLECEAYARKLARSGVKTKLIQYNGMDHAFMDKIGLYPQAEDCMMEIAIGVKNMMK